MKFTVTAGAFANALALATLLGDDRRVKKNQALEAVHLTPDGASVKISANVLDHAVELTLSAVVEEGGTLALSGARLAALAGGFPSKAEITSQADACGGERLRRAGAREGDRTVRTAVVRGLGRADALLSLRRPAARRRRRPGRGGNRRPSTRARHHSGCRRALSGPSRYRADNRGQADYEAAHRQ